MKNTTIGINTKRINELQIFMDKEIELLINIDRNVNRLNIIVAEIQHKIDEGATEEDFGPNVPATDVNVLVNEYNLLENEIFRDREILSSIYRIKLDEFSKYNLYEVASEYAGIFEDNNDKILNQ